MPSQPDLVTLVSSTDQVLGNMDKVEAHRGDAQLHRAISVWLFRWQAGRVQTLLQQRSSQKIVGAYQWANAVCGNVWPSETYLECAYRRLRQEIGVVGVSLESLTKFEYFARCNQDFSEWEVDQVYGGWWSSELELNPTEVQTATWVDWQDFLEQIDQLATTVEQSDPTKLECWVVADGQIRNDLTISLQNKLLTIAPWSVGMLKIPNVRSELVRFQFS